MSEQSAALAEKAIEAFFWTTNPRHHELMSAESALRVHKEQAGFEGDDETQLWHLMLTLATHSDERGFFRDQVFGPRQAGGPRVHQVVCGIRTLCESRGYDFDELYRQVNEHIAIDGPVTPSI